MEMRLAGGELQRLRWTRRALFITTGSVGGNKNEKLHEIQRGCEQVLCKARQRKSEKKKHLKEEARKN